MSRFAINPFGVPAADEFLEKSAERAEPMSGREAEEFFDREWRRVRAKSAEGDEQGREVRRLILIGLACMRSFARAE